MGRKYSCRSHCASKPGPGFVIGQSRPQNSPDRKWLHCQMSTNFQNGSISRALACLSRFLVGDVSASLLLLGLADALGVGLATVFLYGVLDGPAAGLCAAAKAAFVAAEPDAAGAAEGLSAVVDACVVDGGQKLQESQYLLKK